MLREAPARSGFFERESYESVVGHLPVEIQPVIAFAYITGCPGRIPHDLRRTAVRNLVRAGISESVAMTLTGHKTRSVFDRYDITSGEDRREAAQLLNGHHSQRAAKKA